jgi:hypothetical protein
MDINLKFIKNCLLYGNACPGRSSHSKKEFVMTAETEKEKAKYVGR